MDKNEIILLIPITAIFFGVAIGMLNLWLDFRKKRDFMEMHHRERMAAIEKGMEVPPLPAALFDDEARTRTPEGRLRQGLMLLFIGIALTIALGVQQGPRQGVWGLLPAGMGLAQILAYYFDPRRRRPGANDPGTDDPEKNR